MASREPRPPKMPAPLDWQQVGIKLPNDLVYRMAQIQIRDGITRTDLLRRVLTDFCDREERA